jgi:NADP-dependent 3-hydroxy acid dehydrogenase YdfG
MTFPYKTALVLGATSGIGLELAHRLVSRGVYTIVVGRRQDRLDEFVKQHGASKAAGYAYDISKYENATEFAAT